MLTAAHRAAPKTSSRRRMANSSSRYRDPASSAVLQGSASILLALAGMLPASRRHLCSCTQQCAAFALHATAHPATCRMMRAECSRSPLTSFVLEQGADRPLVSRWFERINEIAKPCGENFGPKFPVLSHARREDVMSKESVPAFKKIPVHHSVNMMKVDGLKCFQELVSSMEKSCPLFN